MADPLSIIPVKSSTNQCNVDGIQPTWRCRQAELLASYKLYVASMPIGYNLTTADLIWPDDKRTCAMCGERKPATYYYFRSNEHRADGMDSICRECANASQEQRCKACGEYKPLTGEHWEYEPNGATGFKTVCRACRNARRRKG